MDAHMDDSPYAFDVDDVDYSLYLVTGRELLPPGKDYYESLRESIKDGRVTLVQLREKHADTGEFLEIAKRSLAICDEYHVPMLINDNIGVALALPERVGLHIGQTDMPVALARQLLGPKRLLGLSVHNVQQAEVARRERIANYVGVGPVYGTQSKAGIEDKDVLGPRGAHEVVKALYGESGEERMPCVLIGGINQKTALRALVGSSYQRTPDGIAVISAIVARSDPDVATSELAECLEDFYDALDEAENEDAEDESEDDLSSTNGTGKALKKIASLFGAHYSGESAPPLIQTITSHVSSTLSANIALAFKASPIMSHQAAEAADLGKVVGGVVLNIGTISQEALQGMHAVGQTANLNFRPIVLDPVGVGASQFRRSAVKAIMDRTQVTLLKGNAAELAAISGSNEVQSRGVDSGAGALSNPVNLVIGVARQEKCLVVMTGAIDYLTDGHSVVKVHNGHPLLGRITGSGCALGVILAAAMASVTQRLPVVHENSTWNMVAANRKDLTMAALMGLVAYNVAAEVAAKRPDVRGPGSFIPALIDEVAALTPERIKSMARIEVV